MMVVAGSPVRGAGGVFRLVRDDGRGARPVAGCLLKDLLVRYVAPGEVSPLRAYLEAGRNKSVQFAVQLWLRSSRDRSQQHMRKFPADRRADLG